MKLQLTAIALLVAIGLSAWGTAQPTTAQPQPIQPMTTLPMALAPQVAATTIAAGGLAHTCALTSGGGVKCWGRNDMGQLGDGTATNRYTPVDVSGLTSGVTAIAAGGAHVCALTTGGGVKCWGFNGNGQLGDGTATTRYTPVNVSGLASGVTAIAAGEYHTCALTSGGGVKCWGKNTYGQLGNGTTTQTVVPVVVSGLTSGVTAIATGQGQNHTCALTTSGGVKCWGYNSQGQLGDGTITTRTTPVNVVGLTSLIGAIATGQTHTCALTIGGGVKCWGNNGTGQLGDGTITPRTIPVNVLGLTTGVGAIATGQAHTCALMSGGGVKCWGNNGNGQLGDGTNTQRTSPVDVSETSVMTAITLAYQHTCALTTSGGVKCWGYNLYGQLGDGTTTNRNTPVDVIGIGGTPPPPPSTSSYRVSAGYSHTCALTICGGVKCWGKNVYGQLGDGTTTRRTTPVDVSGLTRGVTAIATGREHTCALTSGGGVKCWGWNFYGQLGEGSTAQQRTAPVDVSGLTSGVIAIAAGNYHTCALTSGGGVKCWGLNVYGQLGDSTSGNWRSTPVDVSGLTSGATAIAAGYGHTCALTTGSGVKCWGWNNSGQVGDGTTVQRNTPVNVSGLSSGVVAIANGGTHACALTSSGGLKCWGDNTAGQLGDGTTTVWRTTPIDVSGLTSGVSSIGAGFQHTCALTTGGGAKCWGWNGNSQLGDGTTSKRITPVNVSGLTSGMGVISPGGMHTCAATASGEIKCWGANIDGQLGDGTTTQRATPVAVSRVDEGCPRDLYLPLVIRAPTPTPTPTPTATPTATPTTPPGYKNLNIPPLRQQCDQWCWDGVSQMILVYYNGQTPLQCEIANYAWNRNDCCPPTWPCSDKPLCNKPNKLWTPPSSVTQVLAHWGVTAGNGVGSYLSFSDVNDQISKGYPIVRAITWTSGDGHATLIRGVNTSTNHLFINDPWDGVTYVVTYDSAVHTSTYDWTSTLYNIHR